MNKLVVAGAIAALAVAVGVDLIKPDAVVAPVGDKLLVTALIKDAKGAYGYHERVALQGSTDIVALLPGEQLVEIVKSLPCDGGQSARCAAGDDRVALSPCVRAAGADCFRTSPGKARRFFGLQNVFLASEASGTQCEPVPCKLFYGDVSK